MKIKVICPICGYEQIHKHFAFPKEFEAIFNLADQSLQTVKCLKCGKSFKYRIKSKN